MSTAACDGGAAQPEKREQVVDQLRHPLAVGAHGAKDPHAFGVQLGAVVSSSIRA
jgi:hypothetical protein